ncbi:ribonuclease R [Aurantivibrio plasticivorans]
MSKRKRSKPSSDPYAKREASQYENPIPSREYILEQLRDVGKPLTHDELTALLNLSDPDDVEALRRRLIAMERDGQLIRDRRRAYGVVDRMHLLRGRVQGHRDGYGFFIPQDGGEDLYLTSRQMDKVFDGDEVLVRSSGYGFKGKKEGSIVEVLSHNTRQVVGRFYKERGIQFVRPDNPRLVKDILVPLGEQGDAESGQYVVVDIEQQPTRSQPPAGPIVQVLGDHMAPGMEIDVAVRSHGIPNQWPGDVLDEASQLPSEVDEADKKHRVDLRKLPFVTIDGEDARDFDDAVYCERKKSGGKPSGWRLWVAIADVSHYVNIDSPLDREAQLRSTSVYFPDYVIPMLPEALSNGLCSLNPEVDRLTMVCEMTISEAGKVSGYKFYEGLIHSHARLTYTKVGQMLEERGDNKSGIRKHYHNVVRHVDELHSLYTALRGARDERGAIDFETVETRIIFDQNRKIEKIIPVVRNDAHKIIEECMLCANVCAAKFLEKHELVGLYRVHEGPTDEKLENLRDYLAELGLYLPGGRKPKPEHYQELMAMIEDRVDAHMIQTMMLRSLRQAVYSPENEGHFGLNYTAYTHFTSPIRRYPDLLTHRAIRHVIRSRQDTKSVKRVTGAKVIAKQKIYPYDMAMMLQLGEHTSLAERRADDATRDVVSWLKCEFLQAHVGDTFQGVVTSVVGFGLFVELEDLYVEGLVHITSLPRDYYYFEPSKMRLVGENTRRVFRLGDELAVQVARVDLEDRKIDFELIEAKGSKTYRISKQEAQQAMNDARRPNKKNRAGKKSKSTKKDRSERGETSKGKNSSNSKKKGTARKRRR